MVEHSYSQANLEVVARDMFTEMGVSDHLAGDMFTKRVMSEEDVLTSNIDERDVFRSRIDGDVYTCPLVMSDSCNIDPIGNIRIVYLYQSTNKQYYINRSP